MNLQIQRCVSKLTDRLSVLDVHVGESFRSDRFAGQGQQIGVRKRVQNILDARLPDVVHLFDKVFDVDDDLRGCFVLWEFYIYEVLLTFSTWFK